MTKQADIVFVIRIFSIINYFNPQNLSVNKQQKLNLERETVPAITEKPENGATDEFEAMVQVMKGRPLIPKTQNQAINVIQKVKGTEIYNKLIDRIDCAKQQVETALNDTKQPDYVNDWKNFDISKYMPV